MFLNLVTMMSWVTTRIKRAGQWVYNSMTRVGRSMSATVAVGASLALAAGVAMVVPNSFATGGLSSAGARSAVPVGMGQLAELIHRQHGNGHLAKATSVPQPAPASVSHSPALRPHEVFAFAPYWNLDQSQGFDVSDLTTLAYFSIDANPDGSFDTSGAGWNGFTSQDFVNLVNRAHGAGDRVVLTVTDFDQSSLDQITSDPSAATRLAESILWAVEAKNLDGVNIDFEGDGSADQAGLTALMATVSKMVHAANPHYQVTMDTYASSAGDPSGFYNIPALAPYVDGFFVMAYEQNLQSAQSAASPITSGEFSDRLALQQYTRAVSPSKVIMGVPFYGEDFLTSDGTQTATAESGATPLTYAQIVSSGHPVYWDSVTDTAWTSYVSGGQWHETYFQDPTSMYMESKMAQSFNVGGMGVWALGMDGNSPSLLRALLGHAPAEKDTLAGPTSTGVALPASTLGGGGEGSGGSTSQPSPGTSPSTAPGSSTTGGTTSSSPTTNPTTPPSTSPTVPLPPSPVASASYQNTSGIDLYQWPSTGKTFPTGSPILAGTLTDFATSQSALSCLTKAPDTVSFYKFNSDPGVYFVLASATGYKNVLYIPAACTTATLYFQLPPPSSTTTEPPQSSSTTPSSSTSTTAGTSASTEPTSAAVSPNASTTEPSTSNSLAGVTSIAAPGQ